MEKILSPYPVRVEMPVAWGEMDAFGHVNNVMYFRYFESARMAFFEKIGFIDHMEAEGVGPILFSTSCRFRFPLTYPDQLVAGARVAIENLQEDRFLMDYIVVSRISQKIAATGEGMIVAYDYRQNLKTLVPETIREKIKRLDADKY